MVRFFFLSVLVLFCSLSHVSRAHSDEVNSTFRTSGFRQPQRNVTPDFQGAEGGIRSHSSQNTQRMNAAPVKRTRVLSENKMKASPTRITPVNRPKQEGQGQGKKSSSRSAPSIWGTFGALLVVISIIFIVAKLFKKHHPMASANLPLEVMEVLGKRPLDARQTIHFVRCGSRILILGSSPAGLEMLSEVDDPVEVDLISGMCRERTQSTRTNTAFLNLFQATQKKSVERERAADTFPSTAKPESEQTRETPVMDEFADYDSAITRLQQKMQGSSRQSLNDSAESKHA